LTTGQGMFSHEIIRPHNAAVFCAQTCAPARKVFTGKNYPTGRVI
jgi:hypothetical protein